MMQGNYRNKQIKRTKIYGSFRGQPKFYLDELAGIEKCDRANHKILSNKTGE